MRRFGNGTMAVCALLLALAGIATADEGGGRGKAPGTPTARGLSKDDGGKVLPVAGVKAQKDDDRAKLATASPTELSQLIQQASARAKEAARTAAEKLAAAEKFAGDLKGSRAALAPGKRALSLSLTAGRGHQKQFDALSKGGDAAAARALEQLQLAASELGKATEKGPEVERFAEAVVAAEIAVGTAANAATEASATAVEALKEARGAASTLKTQAQQLSAEKQRTERAAKSSDQALDRAEKALARAETQAAAKGGKATGKEGGAGKRGDEAKNKGGDEPKGAADIDKAHAQVAAAKQAQADAHAAAELAVKAHAPAAEASSAAEVAVKEAQGFALAANKDAIKARTVAAGLKGEASPRALKDLAQVKSDLADAVTQLASVRAKLSELGASATPAQAAGGDTTKKPEKAESAQAGKPAGKKP